MQVLETQIVSNSEGVVTVEFLGEGGEKIAVTMAGSDPRPTYGDTALIDRAKEMMVQCAVFETVEHRSAQERNRDFSEPAKPDSPFTFEYRDHDGVRQLKGVEFPNLEAVHDEALRSAIDLLDDTAAEGGQQGWAVRVRDANGKIVLSIDFHEAKRKKAAAE
ncbi:hypothetical protein EOA75_27675 [Mesorhizobium sp. M1A.F.Ca.IN.022.07.1.1]|uniref:DUF6894 family protein n=1 Tax=unclassified Mesorhizobium TaxID=325217 RepID=UPI000FCB3CEF|nr:MULTISPECIES: hypothetical protein [unclassified Mesorhizobium]RUV85102.1 hypothetical protein EOA75_27675 [Mesorhizobium sp. M1A.F.Ca.IN.022.07.1.1]RWG07988.1 MAG: hypothetical protein EOQ54_01760 [Mesorhizobium sp.]RWH04055.1 MAG: hypothetical protein EOQ72_00545 [Mesorhizobium sp.]TIN47847.1 MAG: hypothetical protein E5Y25_04475 [Mesorhizobium sp.]TIR91554.1 MAG: hypothetical protein E5X08_18475 [Mesorhizobium sp.]